MKIIRKPIFQKPNGYWWAHHAFRPDGVYSLHTKDRAAAQREYDRQLAVMRRAMLDATVAGQGG